MNTSGLFQRDPNYSWFHEHSLNRIYFLNEHPVHQLKLAHLAKPNDERTVSELLVTREYDKSDKIIYIWKKSNWITKLK